MASNDLRWCSDSRELLGERFCPGCDRDPCLALVIHTEIHLSQNEHKQAVGCLSFRLIGLASTEPQIGIHLDTRENRIADHARVARVLFIASRAASISWPYVRDIRGCTEIRVTRCFPSRCSSVPWAAQRLIYFDWALFLSIHPLYWSPAMRVLEAWECLRASCLPFWRGPQMPPLA